jgi:hypothetical protein
VACHLTEVASISGAFFVTRKQIQTAPDSTDPHATNGSENRARLVGLAAAPERDAVGSR